MKLAISPQAKALTKSQSFEHEPQTRQLLLRQVRTYTRVKHAVSLPELVTTTAPQLRDEQLAISISHPNPFTRPPRVTSKPSCPIARPFDIARLAGHLSGLNPGFHCFVACLQNTSSSVIETITPEKSANTALGAMIWCLAPPAQSLYICSECSSAK